MTGAALTLLCLTAAQRAALRLMLALLATALLVKTLASSLFFAPDNAWPGSRRAPRAAS
jgi:hypothetical protein